MNIIKQWKENEHNRQLKQTSDKLDTHARKLQQTIARACFFWSWDQRHNHLFATNLPF
jgi:hypothetical protein